MLCHAFAFHQKARHELQGVVLEGAGRSVPQLQRIEAFRDVHRCAGARSECGLIRLSRRLSQERRIVFFQEQRQQFSRQRRVRKRPPLLESGGIHLRKRFRHKQPAVLREALYDRLCCCHLVFAASGTYIKHSLSPFTPPLSLCSYHNNRPCFCPRPQSDSAHHTNGDTP